MSPSTFNQFLSCPKQFYFDHILKAPYSKAAIESSGIGTSVHFGLKKVFEQVDKLQQAGKLSKIKIGELKDLAIASSIEYYKNEIAHSKAFTQKTEDSIREVINNFFNNKKLYSLDELKKTKVLGLEADFKDFSIKFEDGVQVPLRGIVDKVEMREDERGKKTLYVVDYKTYPFDREKRPEVQKGGKVYNQLLYYALVLDMAYQNGEFEYDPFASETKDEDKLDFKARVEYLSKNSMNQTVTKNFEFTKEEMHELVYKIKDSYLQIKEMAQKDNINAAEFFPKNENPLNCSSCYFTVHCIGNQGLIFNEQGDPQAANIPQKN